MSSYRGGGAARYSPYPRKNYGTFHAPPPATLAAPQNAVGFQQFDNHPHISDAFKNGEYLGADLYAGYTPPGATSAYENVKAKTWTPRGGQQQQGDYQPKIWTPDTGVPYAAWVLQTFGPKDPAQRFLYDTYATRSIHQCAACKENGRSIEYEPDTDMTRIVFKICQECRNGGIQMMNREYKLFKAARNAQYP